MLTEKKQQRFLVFCLPSNEEWRSPGKLMLYSWGPERLQRFCREAGKTWIYWPTWTHCTSHRCRFLLTKVPFLSNIKLQHLFLPQGHVGEAGKPGTKVTASMSLCLQTRSISIDIHPNCKYFHHLSAGSHGNPGKPGGRRCSGTSFGPLYYQSHPTCVFYWTGLCLF